MDVSVYIYIYIERDGLNCVMIASGLCSAVPVEAWDASAGGVAAAAHDLMQGASDSPPQGCYLGVSDMKKGMPVRLTLEKDRMMDACNKVAWALSVGIT